jgi:hypothetical protein
MDTYLHVFVYVFVITNENTCRKKQNMVRMTVEERTRAVGMIQAGTHLQHVGFVLLILHTHIEQKIRNLCEAFFMPPPLKMGCK